jgi:DNA-binding CsgD family transcriptional regulator
VGASADLRVRDLITRPVLDEMASAHLFAALGEVPLRVSDAVATSGLSLEAAAERAGAALRLQGLLRDHARTTQSDAFGRVQEAIARASRDATPSELLARAPEALCEACGFDRAVISRVENGHWVPRVLHTVRGGSPRLADLLTGLRIPLKAGLVESEVARRRLPALVEDAGNDARTYRPLVDEGGVRSYVVGSVVVGGRVVGLVHADRASAQRPLTRLDRDMAQLFADCFGRAYERAVLSERVAVQRASLRQAFSAEERVSAPDPTVVRFSGLRAVPLIATTTTCVEPRRGEALSARELEVLSLLSTGATNLQIAEELVVSESTVKWHVKRILRKLRAANRAEAAYLHLRTQAG